MPIDLKQDDDGRTMVVHVTGKLSKEDYDHFVPEFDRLAGLNRKPCILFDMTDFHGWTACAIWEDTKFAFHHFSNFERLAIVGEKKWQEGMAAFCQHFTTAEVKYFDHNQLADARNWLQQVKGTA